VEKASYCREQEERREETSLTLRYRKRTANQSVLLVVESRCDPSLAVLCKILYY